ncbi:hypothetical protein LJC42_06020, partial [Eubacteriales bacterium OttesenSCG-928-K08]|nr:hypothetical protein [Eubacteriales bacterium OttesenSCG-928-K08]
EELDEQYDYALFRGDRYSFRFTDTFGYNYMLERYDYLGDGLYYLSFASNDSHWPGHPENLNGILKDFCRLLVKRSDSKWGFTVVAKLKDGEDRLLPEDFPLPKIAVG